MLSLLSYCIRLEQENPLHFQKYEILCQNEAPLKQRIETKTLLHEVYAKLKLLSHVQYLKHRQ